MKKMCLLVVLFLVSFGLYGFAADMQMAAKTPEWSINATAIEACSCPMFCQCYFNTKPAGHHEHGMAAETHYCRANLSYKVNHGHYGDVKLDGLGVAFAAHWPKAIHEGNGTCGLIFDERATPQQRLALLQICSGQAGGLPFEMLPSLTFSKIVRVIGATPRPLRLSGHQPSLMYSSHTASIPAGYL